MGFNKKFFTTGGIVASAAPAAVSPADDPFSHFETVTYTGNGSTQKITGYIRKGAAFNGSANITTSLDFNDLTNYSISLWLYADSNGFFAGTINSSGNSGLWLQLTSGNNVNFIERTSGGTSYTVTSTGTITANDWNHILAVRDGSTNYLYINNGSPDSISNTTITHATDFTLGRAGAFTTSSITGKIDQVRIFNTAITDSTKIAQLAAEDYSKATKSTTDIFGDGSGVALYQLDDDANDTGVAIDSGQSGVFDGSSSVITLPSALSDGVTTTAQTISFWFYVENEVTSSTSNNEIMTFSGTSSVDGKVALGSTTGSFTGETLSVTGNLTNSYNYIKDNIPAGWNHVVLQWETNKWQVYLNGSSKTTFTHGTPVQNKWKLKFGNRSIFYFNGKLDDIRIYSDQLTSGEINAIFNNTTASIPTDYIAYYKLDGNGNDETTNYNATSVSNVTYSDPALLTQYNGTPTNVNFLGMAFQPDAIWIKSRDNSRNHRLNDSLRVYEIYPNLTNKESSFVGISSYDSNGFTIGTSDPNYNANNEDYVAWCWKAAGAADTYNVLEGGTVTSDSTASGAGITAGSITTGWEVSANRDAGFSIVSYTGNGTAGATVGHGLSSAPELIISKNRDEAQSWIVNATAIGKSKILTLNTSGETLDRPNQYYYDWNDTTITMGSDIHINGLNDKIITYCFHSVDEYQKVGSYSGNSTSGRLIDTGFQPRFVMIKTTNATSNWFILDALRGGTQDLRANSNADEETRTNGVTFVSNGFEIDDTSVGFNNSSTNYIYLAIA